MDLERMFDDLFTTYSSLDPPPIKRKTDDLTKLDLKEIDPNSYKRNMVSTIDSPDINWSLEQEGVYNPFSFQTDEPYFEPQQNNTSNSLAQNAVELARSYVGGKYVYGGKNPNSGFDCSGLISYVYKQCGVNIPATTFELFKTGTEVSLSNAQVGDIICTPGSGRSGRHVKMISKIDPDGQIYTIEAKGRKYGIVESPLTRTDNIVTIRRITGQPTQSLTTQDGTFSSRKDFVQTLNSTYRQVLREHGLDPDYSYILTSSAAMESGWGKKVSGTFNYGGVKGKTGSVKSTIDWINGQYIRRNQTFRNFSSVKDYCNYVVNLLSNKRYNAFNSFSPSNPLALWRHVLDAGYGGGDSAGKDSYMRSISSIYDKVTSWA